MKKRILSTAVFFVLGFSACTEKSKPAEESQKADNKNKTEKLMENLVSIVEIPVTDFSRAVTFYQTILNVKIEEVAMGDTQMGVWPSNGEVVSVALVKGNDYMPTTKGAVVYLNTGKDLQPTLDKIEKSGGKVTVPKTQISPEMGYFALFTDTEGNKLGLHSTN